MTDAAFISRVRANDQPPSSSPQKPRCFVRNKRHREYVTSDVVNSFKSGHREYITFDARAFLVAPHDASHAAPGRRMGEIKGDINYARYLRVICKIICKVRKIRVLDFLPFLFSFLLFPSLIRALPALRF